MTPLLGAGAGLAVGLGLLLTALGIAGVGRSAGRLRRSRPLSERIHRIDKNQRRAIIIGAIAGVVLYAISGWLILLIAMPAGAAALPVLLGAHGAKRTIEQLEAIETWTRSLAGVVSGDANLEQAIIASYRSAPEAIREQLTLLVSRLQARIPAEDALQAFADDIDDASADVVVAHLKLASRQRGAGLARALDAAAETLHDEIKVRHQVEADRARPRQATRIVALVTIGFVLVAALATPLAGTFFAAYRTPVGQLLIAVWLLAFAGLLVWQYFLAKPRPLARFLVSQERR